MATAMIPESQSTDRAITVRFKRSITVERFLLPLLAIALLLLAACGPTNPSAPGSTLSAEAVLEQARLAMDAVQSYRYTGEISIEADEDVPKTHLEGEWASPGDSRVRISKAGPDEAILQEFVSVGGRALGRIAHLTGGDWIRMAFPVTWALSRDLMFPELDDAEVAEGETIDGRPMYYVTGLFEPDVQQNSAPQVSRYGLFVDQETMRLRRLVINTEFSAPGPAGEAVGQEFEERFQYSQHVVYDYFDYNEPVAIELPPFDPCNFSADTKELLSCGRFSQRVYWLGDRLETTGAPSLELDGAWVSYGNDDDVITEDSRLTVVYRGQKTTGGRGSIYLEQWSRPAWEKYVARFTGYDPGTVPAGGPVNWWQHPCVEEEIYDEANGAEVRLFKAHLPSLTLIYPMTEEQVSQCLNEPIGAVGAHVYFEETVIEFSVQDSVGPTRPPATVQVLAPGATPPVYELKPPYPELVLNSRNPYNDVATVRLIAASLKPYDGD